MFRGMVTPSSARENQIASRLIHDEIFLIEREVRDRAENNFRVAIIQDTIVTDSVIPTPKVVSSIDIVTNDLGITNHGLLDGDYVEFFTTGTFPTNIEEDTEYQVVVVDENTIKLYNKRDLNMTIIPLVDMGTGIITIKKVSTAEQFLKAWDEFYVYEDAPSYIFVLETVEKHFRQLGFSVTRMLHPNNKTIRWKIEW